jgi:DNA excision repair protein ERCC-2
VSDHLTAESIVVFDEAHSIDTACIEAYSMNVNIKTLEEAAANLEDSDLKLKIK